MLKKKKQKKEKQESPTKSEIDDKSALQSTEGQNTSATENKSETRATPTSSTVLPADTSAKKQDTLLEKTPNMEGENTNLIPNLDATTVIPEHLNAVSQTSETQLLSTVTVPEPLKVEDQVPQAPEVLADKLNGNQISEAPKISPENTKKSNEIPEAAKVSSTPEKTELPSTKNETAQQATNEQLTTERKDPGNLCVNNKGESNGATFTPAMPDISKILSNQSSLDAKTDQSNKIDPISTSELENKKELPLKEIQILETKPEGTTNKEQVKAVSTKEATEKISSKLTEGTPNKTVTNQTAKAESPQSNTNEKPLKEDSVGKIISIDKKTVDMNKKPEESKSSEKCSSQAVEKEDKDAKTKSMKNKAAKSKKPNSNSSFDTPSLESVIQKPESLPATEPENHEKVLNAEKSSIKTSSTEPKTETKVGKESTKKADLVIGTEEKKSSESKTNATKSDKANVKEKQEKESKPSMPQANLNESPIADKVTKPTADQKLIIENKKAGTPNENENQKMINPDATTIPIVTEDKEVSKLSTNEIQSNSKSKKKKQDKQNSSKTSESEGSTPEAKKVKPNPAKSEPTKGTTKTKPSPIEGNEEAAFDQINTTDKKNDANAIVTESAEPKSAQNQIKQAKQKGKASDQNKVNTAQNTHKDTSVVDPDNTNKENTSPSSELVTSETAKGKSGKKKNKKQKIDQNKDDKQVIKAIGGDNTQGQEATNSSKEQNDSPGPQKGEGSKKSKRKGPKANKTDTAQLENSKDAKQISLQNTEVNNTDVLKDNKTNIEIKKVKASVDPNNAKPSNQNILISENKQESDKNSNDIQTKGDLSDITGPQNDPGSELASSETAKKRRRRKRKKQNRGETQDGKSDVKANEIKTDTPSLKKKLNYNLSGTIITEQQEKINAEDGNIKSSKPKLKMNQEEREQKLLKKKLAERAQQKLRNQIESNNLSDTEISEKYVETLSKNIKELTKMRFFKLDDSDAQFKENDSDIDSDCEVYEYVANHRVTYLANFCHVCKDSLINLGSNVRQCNQCFLINYCSVDHQNLDWPKHESLCKTVVQLCKRKAVNHLFQDAVGLSPEAYRIFRLNLLVECSYELNRELEPHEREMILYPNICHTCYEYDKTKLESCVKCNCVSYCSTNHRRESHNTWCNDLQIYVSLVRYQSKNGIIRTNLPYNTTKIYDMLNLNMESILKIMLNDISLLKSIEYVTLTEIATAPLTALFAMYKTNREIENKETLVVHFVGAEWFFELDQPKKWEVFILHFLSNIKRLTLVFIGPEVAQMSKDAIAWFKNNPLCDTCKEKKYKVDQYVSPIPLYHDYICSDSYVQPDLICAYNAGLYRNTGYNGMDTWEDTIESILKLDTPIAITSYTSEEIAEDMKRLRQNGNITVLLPPSPNPYRSYKPSRSFINDEINPVIFKNYHIAIVKGKM